MTDTPNYDNMIVTTWSKKINAGLNKSCTMLQCVNRDYQAEAKENTSQIKIATPNNITVGSYTGTLPSYSNASFTSSTLSLNQSLYFAFSVPDIAQVQSNVALADSVVEKAQKAIDEGIDKYVFSLNSQADENNVIGATTAVELTTSNIYSQFVSLAKLLKNTGAINANKQGWVVVHPDIEEILLLCEQFSGASNGSDATKKEGSIGKIAGLNVYVSNNVGKETSGYTVMAGTTDGITYASQLTKLEHLRAEQSFDTIVRGLYTFGALAINPKALAVMKCSVG